MSGVSALPFRIRRSREALGATELTTTTETVHGLLRLDDEHLVVQWRVARKTERYGSVSMSSDEEVEAVRETVIPLEGIAGSAVRRPRWMPWAAPRFVLTARDLRAFEKIAGAEGLRLDHPAQLVLGLRRGHRLAAEEFSAELAMALVRHGAERAHDRELESGEEAPGALGPG